MTGSTLSIGRRTGTGDVCMKAEDLALDPWAPGHYILDFDPPAGVNESLGWRFLHAENGHIWVYWWSSGQPASIVISDYTAETGSVQSTHTDFALASHGLHDISDAGYAPNGTDVIFLGSDRLVKLIGSSFQTMFVSASAEFKRYGHDGTKRVRSWSVPLCIRRRMEDSTPSPVVTIC